MRRIATAVLLGILILGGCGRVRVGKGSEDAQRKSNQERLVPKAPSERQPESLPVVEVDLEKPKHYKPDKGEEPPKTPNNAE